MKTYIAILRGINVSGQKKIKMADLRSYLEELDFKNIQTYIQSGNIIFDHESTDQEYLAAQVEQKIKEKYGFLVPTIIRTPAALAHILDASPFASDEEKDSKRFYVTFLSEAPLPANIEKLAAFDYAPEEYFLDGKNIYFFSPDGYGRAKMNNNFFENKLKVSATTRNWKTVNKLLTLATDR